MHDPGADSCTDPSQKNTSFTDSRQEAFGQESTVFGGVIEPTRPRTVSLLFHDVLRRGEGDGSDGRSIGVTRYRFDHDAFALYLGGLREALRYDPITVDELITARCAQKPFMLTFDDGAMNAYTNVMELLDRYDWKAHFFVVTSWIGQRGYLGASHLRILRAKGHVIGSHSHSHPSRMSSLDPHTIYQEWAESRRRLSQILGEPVLTASVPGGEYSRQVAVGAAQAGFKALFTSEPVSRTEYVRNCLILGRYVVRSTTDALPTARLVRGHSLPEYSALILWNLRKLGKNIGKQAYLRLRLIAMRRLYA